MARNCLTRVMRDLTFSLASTNMACMSCGNTFRSTTYTYKFKPIYPQPSQPRVEPPVQSGFRPAPSLSWVTSGLLLSLTHSHLVKGFGHFLKVEERYMQGSSCRFSRPEPEVIARLLHSRTFHSGHSRTTSGDRLSGGTCIAQMGCLSVPTMTQPRDQET